MNNPIAEHATGYIEPLEPYRFPRRFIRAFIDTTHTSPPRWVDANEVTVIEVECLVSGAFAVKVGDGSRVMWTVAVCPLRSRALLYADALALELATGDRPLIRVLGLPVGDGTTGGAS